MRGHHPRRYLPRGREQDTRNPHGGAGFEPEMRVCVRVGAALGDPQLAAAAESGFDGVFADRYIQDREPGLADLFMDLK